VHATAATESETSIGASATPVSARVGAGSVMTAGAAEAGTSRAEMSLTMAAGVGDEALAGVAAATGLEGAWVAAVMGGGSEPADGGGGGGADDSAVPRNPCSMLFLPVASSNSFCWA